MSTPLKDCVSRSPIPSPPLFIEEPCVSRSPTPSPTISNKKPYSVYEESGVRLRIALLDENFLEDILSAAESLNYGECTGIFIDAATMIFVLYARRNKGWANQDYLIDVQSHCWEKIRKWEQKSLIEPALQQLATWRVACAVSHQSTIQLDEYDQNTVRGEHYPAVVLKVEFDMHGCGFLEVMVVQGNVEILMIFPVPLGRFQCLPEFGIHLNVPASTFVKQTPPPSSAATDFDH
ncbi:hypothetical protein AJ80_09905 [Polytolypa hystricis UAMH7299]|uniref:Uncharacterized protein n=1 Tax=Polytolypa hystricis (strain UAMH7299) TaxID=1447883 RepID=A0A2B7W8G7_POLH7|nr:hypothetical protein AJ80_09905 [Polytolypa hystricis UAMH7299]